MAFKVNRGELSKNLNLLHNSGAKNKHLALIYVILQCISIIYLVMAEEFIDWIDWILAETPGFNSTGTSMNPGSNTRKVASVINSIITFRQAGVSTVFIAILLLTAFLCYIPIIVVTKELNPRLVKWVAMLTICYSSIFIPLNQLFLRCIFCKGYSIFDGGASEIDSYIEANVQKRLLQTSQTSTFILATQASSSIICYSPAHIGAAIIALAGIVGNSCFFALSGRLLRFVPEYDFEYTHIGRLETVKGGIFFLLIIIRATSIHFFENNIDLHRYIQFQNLVVFLLLVFIQISIGSFFRRWIERVSILQLQFGASLISLNIIPIYLDYYFEEYIGILLIILFLVATIRLSDNIKEYKKQSLLNKWTEHPKSIKSESSIADLYFILISIIHEVLEDHRRKLGDSPNLHNFSNIIYFGRYIKNHSLNCKIVTCSCITKFIPYEFDPLGEIQSQINHSDFISLALFILDDYLKSFVTPSTPEKIKEIISYFEIVYKGQLLKSFVTLKSNEIRHAINNTNFFTINQSLNSLRLFDMMRSYCYENAKEGHLGLSIILKNKNIIVREYNQLQVLPYLEFLGGFQTFKTNILEAIDYKSKFLACMISTGNLSNAYLLSEKFSCMSEKIIADYPSILNKLETPYSPIVLIYGIFQFFLYQNISVGRKAIADFKMMIEKNRFQLKSFKVQHELCLVYAFLNKSSIGEVSYVTANILRNTGFQPIEILKEGIDILVPPPITVFHQRLFSPGRQGGNLNRVELLKTFCNTKKGNIVQVELSVRHSLSILRGVEYVSCVCFPEVFAEDLIILIDKNGLVSASNSIGKKYFDVGKNISIYNVELKKDIDSMQELLEARKATYLETPSFEKLIKSGQVDASMKYYSCLQYRWIHIYSKRNQSVKMEIKFEKQYFPSMDFNFWVLRAREIEGKTLIPSHDPQSQRRNSVKTATLMIAKLLQKAVLQSKKNEDITEEENNLSEIPEENSASEFDNKLEKITTHRLDQLHMKKDPLEKKAPKVEINHTQKSNTKNGLFSKIIRKNIIFKNLDNSVSLKSAEGENYSFSSASHNKILPFKEGIRGLDLNSEKHIKTIKDRLELVNIESSIRSSYNHERMKLNKLSMIIHTYIKPEAIHIPVKITFVGLLVVVLSLSALTLIKVPVQKTTNTEVKEQAITLDYFSKQLWGFTQTLLVLERFRFMKEDFMGKLMELRPGKPVRTRLIRKYYNESCNVLLLYEMLISAKIANVTDRSLFKFDSWVNTKAMIHNYHIDQETGRPIWFMEEMTKVNAIEFLSARMRKFYLRDYENDTLPFIGYYRDRDNDPEEDLFRRNYIGDIYNQILNRKSDFNEYLKNLSMRNESYIIWTFVSSLAVAVIMMLLLWAYLIQELSSMQFFYQTIFKIKKSELEDIVDEWAAREIYLKESIKEEELEVSFTQKTIEENALLKYKSVKNQRLLPEYSSSQNTKVKLVASDILRVNRRGLPGFGVKKIIMRILLLLIGLCLVQFLHFYSIYPRSKRVTDLTKAYSLSVDTWSSYYRTLTLFTEVIAWNDTISGGYGELISSTFDRSVEYIEQEILQNITESKTYDLGDFTQNYSNIYFTGNSCQTVYTSDVHPNCNQYFNGLFNGNYYDSLRGMLEVLKGQVLIWKYNRNTWDIVPQLIKADILQAYWNLIFPITSSIYYILTVPLTSSLMNQLEDNLNFLGIANNVVMSLLVALFVIGFLAAILQLQKSLRLFHSIFFIIPFDILDKNMLIRQSLSKIRNGEFFFKLRK